MHQPLKTSVLPGPTGESNRLSVHPKGTILCLGPDADNQAKEAREQGCTAITVNGNLEPDVLKTIKGIDAVVYWGQNFAPYREALSMRDGALIPLITTTGDPTRYHLERHLCIDTTASGGNADLLAAADQPNQ